MNLECCSISHPSKGFTDTFQATFSEGISCIHAKAPILNLLFHLLTGNLIPENGHILFLGYDIHYLGDAYRNHLSFLTRYPLYPGSFPLYHYLVHLSLLQRIPGRYIYTHADHLLNKMELESMRNLRLEELSADTQNRLRIFQTLLSEAPILILEETPVFRSEADRIKARNILADSMEEKIILFLTEKEDPFPDLPHQTYVIQ